MPAGHTVKKRRLEDELERLKAVQPGRSMTATLESQEATDHVLELEPAPDIIIDASESSPDEPSSLSPTKRRILPNETANNLYNAWSQVLPGLVDSLLTYVKSTTGQALHPLGSIKGLKCQNPLSCTPRTSKITCLFFDRRSLILSGELLTHTP